MTTNPSFQVLIEVLLTSLTVAKALGISVLIVVFLGLLLNWKRVVNWLQRDSADWLRSRVFIFRRPRSYLADRFMQVRTECLLMGGITNAPTEIQELLSPDLLIRGEWLTSKKEPRSPLRYLTWADVHALELWKLRQIGDDPGVLRRTRVYYHGLLREIIPAEELEIFSAESEKPEVIRHEIEQMLTAMHRAYALYPEEEHARTRALHMVFLSLLIPTLALIVWLIMLEAQGKPAGPLVFSQMTGVSLLYVMTMGAAGAFISFQLRLHKIGKRSRVLVSIVEQRRNIWQFFYVPLSGAVFAFVVMALIGGGFIQGPLFPQDANLLHRIGHDGELNIFTLSEADFFKLTLWTFVSGFAEKFVPDAIDRVVARKSDDRR